MALITNFEYDHDSEARIVELAYTLSQEQVLPLAPNEILKAKRKYRFTRRGIHTLVKIYSVSDPDINADIAHLNSILSTTEQHDTYYQKNEETEGTMQGTINTNENPLTSDLNFTFLMVQMGYLVFDKQ